MTLTTPPLDPNSEDFAVVEYILQMQLNAPQFRISAMHDISNRRQKNDFAEYVNDLKVANIVDVFIPLSQIQQPLSDILVQGVRIPKTGLKIQTDKLTLTEEKENYEVIHLIVALGNIHNYQNLNSELEEVDYVQAEPTINDIPDGYDTIRVSNNDEFYIFTPSQIKTAHYITFKGGDNLTHDAHELHVCGVCGKNNATLWCEKDGIKLCEECDKVTHESNPLFQAHVRIPINDALPSTQTCPDHKDQRVTYYCPKCHVHVCMECKINGSHSHGDAARHKLVPLEQAYNQAKQVAARTNPTYVTRQQMLDEKLGVAKRTLTEIEENFDLVEKEILRIANEAIASARAQAGQRATAVKSIIVELERKKSELADQERFLRTHMETSEPLDFLRFFAASKEMEKELMGSQDVPERPTVAGDLVVYGELEVAPPRHIPDDPSVIDEPAPLRQRGGLPSPGRSDSFASPRRSVREEESAPRTATYTTEESATQDEPRNVKVSHLTKIAARKEGRLNAAGTPLTFAPFAESKILLSEEEARTLYLCFPFKGVPETHLMYSTERDGRSMGKMHKLVDGMGITAVIVKSGDFRFGGFAATKWNSDGVPFGENASCFLFSLNKNVLVPFRPQTDEPVKLFATKDSITFGMEDLKLAGDRFDQCSSVIEHSYGLGYLYEGEVAKTFLAGQPEFTPDIVEVWGFFSPQ